MWSVLWVTLLSLHNYSRAFLPPTHHNRERCHSFSSQKPSSAHIYDSKSSREAIANDILNNNSFISVTAVAACGLQDNEASLVLEAIRDAFIHFPKEYLDDFDVEFQYDVETMYIMTKPLQAEIIPGALGRVLLLKTNLLGEGKFNEEEESSIVEIFQFVIAEKMDQLLYNEKQPLLKQPILISIDPNTHVNNLGNNNTRIEHALVNVIKEQVDRYEMRHPISTSNERYIEKESNFVPQIQVEMDGAYVKDDYSSEQVWDTSSILVFDDLVSNDLRKRLLDVTLGGNDDWDDITQGPNPDRWVKGGLIDIPDEDSEESPVPSSSWGLSDECIEEICFQQHHAIQEFEMILTQLFPQFVVTRLPEAVFGSCVSPLTANAPTFGDKFEYHIDADPKLTPPSPWTDVFGRYPNRIRGKPRFMSCLLYLNDHWKQEWGAPTRFWDLPTNKKYEVVPRPGRCVLMDQDCTHTVVAPKEKAEMQPRYSLVWKLILHPRLAHQNMTNLKENRKWPHPILFGSANRC
jgi:hypothetical protein